MKTWKGFQKPAYTFEERAQHSIGSLGDFIASPLITIAWFAPAFNYNLFKRLYIIFLQGMHWVFGTSSLDPIETTT